jgi:hypothetical protein
VLPHCAHFLLVFSAMPYVGDLLLVVLGAFGLRAHGTASDTPACSGAAAVPEEASVPGLCEEINRDCMAGLADLLLALSAFGTYC